MFKISEHKKIYKNYGLLLFILFLFTSFICLNISSGLVFSRWKADLTSDSRYSLSKNSKKIISEINSPLYIRVYLSSAISKDYPALYQYSQTVLRRLEGYKNLNPENIMLEVRDPEPYSPTAEEAKRLGLKSFLSADGQSELYFGAVLGNDNGDTRNIEQFSPARANYLESDISRAINALNNPLSPKIGIVTGSLPISEHNYGEQAQTEWAFLRLLRNEYNIVKLSALTPEIPYDLEALIIVAPQKMSSLLTYAIDQYLLRGGRVLLLVDPYSEENKQALGLSDSLNKLLKNWGIAVDFSKVVGNMKLGEKFIDENQTGQIFYTNPLWLNLTQTNIDSSKPFGQGISLLSLRSAGNISITKQDNISTTALLSLNKNSGNIATKDLRLQDAETLSQKLQPDEQAQTLAVLLEGRADSSFLGNPLRGTGFEEDMLPFLPTSLKEGKLLIIADTDLLADSAWVNEQISGNGNTYDITAFAQNGEFILRAMDYLTDMPTLAAIGSKQLSGNAKSILQKIYLQKLEPYQTKYEQNKKQLIEKQMLNKSWNEIIQNNETIVNMSILKKLEQNRQEINNLQDELKRTEYLVRKATAHTTDIITWINVFAIPVLLLLILWVFNLLRTRRNQNKVREIINEYKIS